MGNAYIGSCLIGRSDRTSNSPDIPGICILRIISPSAVYKSSYGLLFYTSCITHLIHIGCRKMACNTAYMFTANDMTGIRQ